MWWLDDLKTWTEVILNVSEVLSIIITAIAGLIAALWVYTKFVVERGSFPGVQSGIELATTGMQINRKIVEFLIHLKNTGSSTLVAKNLRFDLLYLNENVDAALFDDGGGTRGKLYFPDSIGKDIKQGNIPLHHVDPVTDVDISGKEHTSGKKTRGVLMIGYDTFVLPGVDQTYTFATSIPQDATYVLAWSSFEYGTKLTNFNAKVLDFGRRLGLIQYSLARLERPHTCERLFKV
jgi:hypothetical protein